MLGERVTQPLRFTTWFRRLHWSIQVLLVLLTVRLALNGFALIGANLSELAEGVGAAYDNKLDPRTLPGVWDRWDSDNYLRIAQSGYAADPLDVNFFPMYPLTIRLFALGLPELTGWMALWISNGAFLLAGLMLWREIRVDFGPKIAWATVITLSLFPTSLYFSAIYAESLLLLWSVLVYSLARRQLYFWAAMCVSLASLTRITGWLLVIIPLVELLSLRPDRWLRRSIGVLVIASASLTAYCLLLWVTRGSPLAFLTTQAETMKRSITWPFLPMIDSLRALLTGYGGFEHNWLMRVVSAFDLSTMSLLIVCTILSLRWLRPSLATYAVLSTLFLSVSHGPYSLGVLSNCRYILTIFPAFIILGILLERTGKWKWPLWWASGLMLIILTMWFGSGRWIS